jgi:hypothetical protein
VGSKRQDEDSHLRSGPSPKLSLVGHLHCELDGRPVSLVAENRELVLYADKLKALLALRRAWQASRLPLRSFVERAGIQVLLRSRWFGTLEVLPNPNYFLSFLLPRG